MSAYLLGRRGAVAFSPAAPTVNLLSGEIREIVRVRHLRQRFIAAGAVIVAVTVAVFAGQQGLVIAASNSLTSAQDTQSRLTTQQRSLTPVAEFYAEVAQSQAALQGAMKKEVLFSKLLGDLHTAAPAGVVIGNVSLVVDTRSDADAAAAAGPGANNKTSGQGGSGQCPGPDPFAAANTVGCVTLVGTAVSRDAVGTLITDLANSDVFINPFVSATTVTQDGSISFNATVGLTPKVYSGRYQDLQFLQGEMK